MTQLTVSSGFDSGAIEVEQSTDATDIRLRIRSDNAAAFAQWFHFRVQGAAAQALTLRFVNAGQCAYTDGWEGYQVVASEDRQHWFRIPTSYDGATMTAQVTPRTNSIYFAYFEPYSWERHLNLIASAARSDHVLVQHLGQTADGRDLDLLRITNADSLVAAAQKRIIWLIARQHPGETMAEWFVDGLLERLLDGNDALSRVLLQQCIFHVVPNMNPDGSVRGNLRTNALGVNLNREWAQPSMERSPEVLLVRARMESTGVDLCLDVHGDEGLPYNFVAGADGIPGFGPRLRDLQDAFKAAWITCNPDFQDRVNYGATHANKANMALATNWVAHRFDCLALTIEMPFKDNADLPDPVHGWSSVRSRRLGASVLQAVRAVADSLR